MSEPLFKFTLDVINEFVVYRDIVTLITGRESGKAWRWWWDGSTIQTVPLWIDGANMSQFNDMVPHYKAYIDKLITDEDSHSATGKPVA